VNILKITASSLVLGLLVLILCLYVFYLPKSPAGQLPALSWNTENIPVETDLTRQTGQNLQIKVGSKGTTVVALPLVPIESDNYVLLQCQLNSVPTGNAIILLWKSSLSGDEALHQRIAVDPTGFISIATTELKDWSGTITALGIAIQGQPGDTVSLSSVHLLPSSLARQLSTMVSDWTSFTPWQHHSVNTHTGTRSSASRLYPVPVMAGLLALSLLSYWVLLYFFRTTIQFDWRIAAGIFLACWIGLDLIWQGKLLRQLQQTYDTFSGRSFQEKLSVGIDKELVELTREVKQHLAQSDSRIFVSSTDDYLGMRGAYYLYPSNVFWKRHGPELPRKKYLLGGDYILILNPTKMHFDAAENTLRSQWKQDLSAELIISSPLGSLLRVK
jgi:hypothetical protein